METAVGAAFEIQDGRIAAWREYFDMSPFVRP
jgi:limonene-1,2-epoxide hydrolase